MAVAIGIFVEICLWINSSAGEASVVLCGVERYSLRRVLRCCFHGIFSVLAAQMLLPSVHMKRSAVALA